VREPVVEPAAAAAVERHVPRSDHADSLEAKGLEAGVGEDVRVLVPEADGHGRGLGRGGNRGESEGEQGCEEGELAGH
jgi:hypothetical protein